MRVIAGKYGGRKLKSPATYRTRPTSDRLRETLFNIVGPRINSATAFLDLCAGTGAVGIEALSRGAGFASFVDIARRNCALIEENLDLIGIPEEETTVECIEAEKFLRQEHSRRFDMVYFDPPYEIDYSSALSLLADKDSKTMVPDGLLIVEHHFKNHLADEIGRLRRWRILRQGESSLSFFEEA